MPSRPLTLAQAQERYPHRFTQDHFPAWAAHPLRRDRLGEAEDYPAPQYASDAEWYERTIFPGEGGLPRNAHGMCVSNRPTFPLGERLPHAYRDVPRGTPQPNPNRKPVTRDADEERSHDAHQPKP